MKKICLFSIIFLLFICFKVEARAESVESILKASLTNALGENNKLSAENKKLSGENKVLNEEKQGLLDNLRTATRERDNLKKNLKVMSDKIINNLISARKELGMIKQENGRLLGELGKISKKNNSLSGDIAKYRDLTRAKEDEISKPYKEQISLLNKEMERLNNENSAFNVQLQELGQKQLSLNQELQQTTNEKNKYQDKFNNIVSAKVASAVASSEKEKKQLSKEAVKTHYDLGAAFFKSSQYKESAKEYEMILAIMPDDASVYYNLGVIYGDYLKDNRKAVEYYNKYLELAPVAKDAAKVKEKIRKAQIN